ncbi:MAG: TIGR01906 family membrane protein [Chloroflexi bacterium]|nr:MAG: TIGR01906 family membrane protein [Chloroflexota bacterium]
MPKSILPLFSWLITLLAPFAVIMLVVRLLLTPVFLQIEYRMPGFPADSYGFSQADRLRWATPSLAYLTNDAGIDFLADLKFDDGTPIYNERELSHMLDVKIVVQKLLNAWLLVLGLLAALAIWARLANWLPEYRLGWRRGGFLTLGLLLTISLFAAVSFWQFFTLFHSLFFSGDSWLFEFSDTLIRLFPLRFWQDCVIFIGGLSVLLGLALGFGLKPHKKA